MSVPFSLWRRHWPTTARHSLRPTQAVEAAAAALAVVVVAAAAAA